MAQSVALRVRRGSSRRAGRSDELLFCPQNSHSGDLVALGEGLLLLQLLEPAGLLLLLVDDAADQRQQQQEGELALVPAAARRQAAALEQPAQAAARIVVVCKKATVDQREGERYAGGQADRQTGSGWEDARR